jgi:hypothetical protein
MRPHRRVLPLRLAAVVVAIGCSPLRSQEAPPAAGEIVAKIPGESFLKPYLAVTAVEPTGQVRFEIPQMSRWRLSKDGDLFVPGDGHALLVVRSAATPADVRFYRVEIREITAVDPPAWSFTAALTPGVAAQLRAGDHALLVRPTCTTRQLRDLPDVISLSAAESAPPDEAREAAARARSITNLKLIGLAMNEFHASFGTYPPAVIAGPNGKPWHSWRVLLLLYLDQGELFNQYRFDEPWDGPNNIKLLDRMPEVYRDPIHGDDRGHSTHYAALVGKATAFPPSGAVQRDAQQFPIGQGMGGATGVQDMTDGTSTTLLVAPVGPERKIPWTKPEDIAVGPDFPGLGRPGGIAAPYRALSGPAGHRAAPVLCGDDSVLVLIDTIHPNVLAALLTRAGGETITFDAIWNEGGPLRVPEFETLRIRRDGDRVRATIDPAAPGREDIRVRTRPTAPAQPVPGTGVPR